MPARRLDSSPTTLNRFDVVGFDADTAPTFVKHIGLSSNDVPNVALTCTVSWTHMGPPLEQNSVPGIPVHVCGTVPLTPDELLQIELFVNEIVSELQSAQISAKNQYVVRPHFTPATGAVSRQRFSCAGFVIEAYREAGIDLLETDEATLPPIALIDLAAAYPNLLQMTAGSRLMERDRSRRHRSVAGSTGRLCFEFAGALDGRHTERASCAGCG